MTYGEKFKTAKERLNAFESWCKCTTSGNCEGCELKDIHLECKNGLVCPLLWLDLAVEEAKPEPCPFCGGKTSWMKSNTIEILVGCENTDCGYQAPLRLHNSVCKMVAACQKSEVK